MLQPKFSSSSEKFRGLRRKFSGIISTKSSRSLLSVSTSNSKELSSLSTPATTQGKKVLEELDPESKTGPSEAKVSVKNDYLKSESDSHQSTGSTSPAIITGLGMENKSVIEDIEDENNGCESSDKKDVDSVNEEEEEVDSESTIGDDSLQADPISNMQEQVPEPIRIKTSAPAKPARKKKRGKLKKKKKNSKKKSKKKKKKSMAKSVAEEVQQVVNEEGQNSRSSNQLENSVDASLHSDEETIYSDTSYEKLTIFLPIREVDAPSVDISPFQLSVADKKKYSNILAFKEREGTDRLVLAKEDEASMKSLLQKGHFFISREVYKLQLTSEVEPMNKREDRS